MHGRAVMIYTAEPPKVLPGLFLYSKLDKYKKMR